MKYHLILGIVLMKDLVFLEFHIYARFYRGFFFCYVTLNSSLHLKYPCWILDNWTWIDTWHFIWDLFIIDKSSTWSHAWLYYLKLLILWNMTCMSCTHALSKLMESWRHICLNPCQSSSCQLEIIYHLKLWTFGFH